jgi:hypothetical protein
VPEEGEACPSPAAAEEGEGLVGSRAGILGSVLHSE